MWTNRNAIAVNGIGARRPDSFVNGTSAYVLEQGVESILVTESPQNGGDLFRYQIPSLANPALDRWDLIGPGLRSYSDQGAGAYDPVRRLYLRTAKMGTSYGIVMWNVATPGLANNPIKFVPPNFNGQFVLSKLHGMDFDPRRSVFVLWNGDGRIWHLKPPASGSALHGNGLDRRRSAGFRHQQPRIDRWDRRARQVEVSPQPRRDARAGGRRRGAGVDLQAGWLAAALTIGQHTGKIKKPRIPRLIH